MINSEALKKSINEHFTSSFLSRIILSYSFSTDRLYNILHAVEFGVDPNYADDDELYDRKYQMERSYRRINNIAIRFKENSKKGAGAILDPKCYDNLMFEAMVRTYNHLCPMLDRPNVTIITDKLLQRAGIEESLELCQYNDSWVKCGYCTSLCLIERKAITLPEVIFYSALYQSTRSRAIQTLNKELTTKTDYVRALRWFKNFMTALNSRELYEAIICEIFDMLFEEISICDNDINLNLAQQFWVDEKYRNRKDKERVFLKLSNLAVGETVLTSYVDKELSQHPEKIDEFFEMSNFLSICEILLIEIIPRAQMIVLNQLPQTTEAEWLRAEAEWAELQEKLRENSEFMHSDECKKIIANHEDLQFREVASWLVKIVSCVVDEGYSIAKELLYSLPESAAWKQKE